MYLALRSGLSSVTQSVSSKSCGLYKLSFVGVRIGNIFGLKFKSSAEVMGGTILVLMGVKILLEHLGIFG